MLFFLPNEVQDIILSLVDQNWCLYYDCDCDVGLLRLYATIEIIAMYLFKKYHEPYSVLYSTLDFSHVYAQRCTYHFHSD